MNNKKLLILALIFLSSIVAWISFDVYHASTATIITAKEKEQIKPLTASFDGDIIVKIKSRER